MEDNTAPDTSNFLDWVEIKNFKSIKDLRLDCKQVNIFIGKPNVGKSNILEALGMLGAEYFENRFMDGAVRYKNIKHLFYQNDSDEPIRVATNNSKARIERVFNSKTEYKYLLEKTHRHNRFVEGSLESFLKNSKEGSKFKNYVLSEKILESGQIQEIKFDDHYSDQTFISLRKYDFLGITEFTDTHRKFLLPQGENLFDIIDHRNDLKNEFGKLFADQGLDLVLDRDNQSFNLQRKDGFYIYKFDYFSIADTFRRFMFYITAIESNRNSVLIFEEPEVHSFPPYTKALAHRIASHGDNQYFITTHSPYLLQTLISEVDEADLAVYITYYKDYQTHVRLLTPDELQEAQDLSIDLFYNLSRYEPNA